MSKYSMADYAAKAREASANAAQPGGGAVIKGGSKA